MIGHAQETRMARRRYTAAKRLFLERHPWCKVCEMLNRINGSIERSTDIHHTRGRLGTLLLHEPWWVPCCRACHDYVGRHPGWAREHGFLCAIGEWNVMRSEPTKVYAN